MSNVLARLRVRETHGIRRFLYPLTAYVTLPEGTDTALCLVTEEGKAVPLQVTEWYEGKYRVDFAVSLAPYAEQELRLAEGEPSPEVDDPLHIELAMEKVLFWSNQKRFQIALRHNAIHRDVVYDGIYFPKELATITCNGREMALLECKYTRPDIAKLSAWVDADGQYPDSRAAATISEITAVKSWEEVIHLLDEPKIDDEIVFTLPLAITSSTLTCDFGVGGYVFGKLDEKAPEIVWRTEFGDAPHARWSVATAGRTDYIGEVATAEAFLPQRWFHLIDSDKALAVAITQVPPDCREMTVRLTHEGDVSVTFRLGDTITGPAEFGVCYHFLNDVPAIAAATNPQSILLPPIVDVLP